MTKTLSSFRNQRNDLDKRQDIAVVGLACRFPKSESVEEFWNSLCEGRFCVTDLSSRQARFRFFQSLPRQGGFLSEIDLFDPDFFSIPSQEAIEIDPLTRQVLLLIPKLFSNASYTLGEIKGKTIGIFIGSRSGTYSEKIAPFHKNSVVGLGQNFIAAYASQVFDLRGPSLVVDAACASSLLSVHLACQSLKSGECDLAIAGGVDLLLDDKPFDLLQAAGALSTRGKCAFFDSEADGIAIGEGVGLVLLKRYADALIDHNGISAVIEGSATNNDGRTMGVTTPNPYQQEHVIRSAIKNAAIDPRSICYIEAHGTGTMIGDPLELQALSRVFSREMMGTKKIGVGSVKANLGHLLSAAGIASLIKVILSLQYKKIPASIHCIQKNPRFVFADSAFDLVQTLIPLEERKEDYRAGVSAFGFGGTNVHLILRNSSDATGHMRNLPPIAYHLRSYWPKKEDRFSTEGFDLSAQHPLLTDHTVQGRPIIPGVTYLAWISSKLGSDRALSHIVFEEPFSLRGEDQARLELTFLNGEAKITSKEAKTGKEITHLRAKWISASVPPLPELDIEKCKRGNIVSFQDLYQYAARVGINHGPFFKNGGQAYLTSDACLLEIQSPVSQDRSAFLPFDASFDPALLDGATFAFIALFFSEFQKIRETFIPIAINHVHFFGAPTQVNYAYVQRSLSQEKPTFHDTYHHDIILYNELGRPIASLKGIVGKRIRKEWKEVSPFQSQETDSKPLHSFLLKKLKQYIPNFDRHALNEEQKFYEMGLDSKNLLDIVKELESEFSTSFYPTLLFEYDTLPALEAFLEHHVDVKPPLESYEAHSQLTSQEFSRREESIAIIGLYGEYGPCKGLPSYWKALQDGTDCVRPVSDKRLKLWGISAEEASGYVGSWMEDIDLFEPGTFRLSPKELEGMDPQERKFLDCVQGCLEEASYKAEDLSATQKVGVFVGVMYGHYELFGQEPLSANTRIPNSSYASIANRVSYVMNWQGPSIAIDTMCSSSLTAIHLACQSLKQGECEVAIAGGVNLHSHAQKFHWLKDTHFLSQNGRCRSFGKRQEEEQDGYVPGEGVGAVLLKPLSQAQKDGDYIWGVILGSAINHGGLAGGYTVPSPAAQQKVVEEAIKQAGINKEEISYIEAHGTGTSLGDPIEIKALQEVFKGLSHPISTGSVKSNIGHLESAAGIAGLTKVLLQMHHKMLVPSLYSSTPNPYINFSQLSLAVQKKLAPWISSTGSPLTAGLSAFGAGGSNAHLILQEYKGDRLAKPLADRRERKSQMKSYWVTKAEKKIQPLESIPEELGEMRIYNVDWGLCSLNKIKSESSINSRLHFLGPEKSLFGISSISILSDLKEDVDQIIAFFEIKADQPGIEKITHFLFESAKVLTALKQQKIWSVVFQVERFEEHALLLAHLGFLKTLHLEHTFLKTRIIFVDKETLPLCFELLQERRELPLCFRLENQCLKSLHISPFQPAKKMESFFLKKGGSYLITGGLGGIGQVISHYLITQWQARLCLMGRSSLDREKENLLQQWRDLGGQVSYVQGDVCDFSHVQKAVESCSNNFGDLNGVIHGAGLMKLCSFEQQNWSDFCSIANPKIKGLINLDRATAHIPLDCFVNFTSHSALLGISQGCDYAYANAFLLGFTAWRKELTAKGQRFGSTLSFLWPRWKEGGIKTSEAVLQGLEKWLWHQQGMRLLTNKVGIGAFDAIMKSGRDGDFLIGEGEAAKMDRFLKSAIEDLVFFKEATLVSKPTKGPTEPTKKDSFKFETRSNDLERWLESLVISILKMDPDDLNSSYSWSEYGFDSIALKEFTDRINEGLKVNILPPVLFGYGTIQQLSSYLLSTYDHLRSLYQGTQKENDEVPIKSCQMGSSAKENSKEEGGGEEIVVVGMECHFPLSPSIQEFWKNVEKDISLIRKRQNDLYGLTADAGFIDHPDFFDAPFFNISEEEARFMDPQQRLLLMLTWNLFESSGIPASKLAQEPVGVFIGAQFNDYYNLLRNSQENSLYVATGNAKSFISNRLSYFFNFKGPSEVVDTACSSSLVAVHHAAQSIRTGESLFAIAGGVTSLLDPQIQADTERLGVISSSGCCKTFDRDADGYVRSEGLALVLLTTAREAKRHNLTVHAKILASGVNHSGRTTSLVAPNPHMQKNLIQSVFESAKINPTSLGYMEAHGTGTELGDSIEIQAIREAFEEMTPETVLNRHIRISSVKTRLGHLEPASGIAGLVTAILALTHRKIPGNLGFSHLNRYIQLEGTPFSIEPVSAEWEDLYDAQGSRLPRRCSVSSFGFSGTNSFLILEEPAQERASLSPASPDKELLFPLSAKTENALDQMLFNFITYLRENPSVDLLRVSYTLCLGREHFPYRSLVVAKSYSDLVGKLHQIPSLTGTKFDSYRSGSSLNWEEEFKDFSSLPLPITLPTYPFQNKSYWFEERSKSISLSKALPKNLEAKEKIDSYQSLKAIWEKIEIPGKGTESPQRIIIIGPQIFSSWEKVVRDFGIRCSFFENVSEVRFENGDEIWLVFKPLAHYQTLASYLEDFRKSYSSLVNFFIQGPVDKFSAIKWMTFSEHLNPERDGFCQTEELGLFSFFISLSHELSHLPLQLFHAASHVITRPNRENLKNYLSSFPSGRIVLFGENGVYNLSFQPVPLSPTEFSSLKKGGTYVVAGGTGTVGQILCHYLMDHYQANIVVVSRRQTVAQLCSPSRGNSYFVEADIANPQAVKEVIFKANCRFGKINGFFFLASDHFEKPFKKCTEEDLYKALHSKVHGTAAVLQILADSSLDFLCFFSSAQVALPAGQRSLYALSCGLQNQIVHQAAELIHFPVKVINWGFWTSLSDEKNALLEQIGIAPITPEAGMKLMEKAFRDPTNHLLIGDFREATKSAQEIVDQLENSTLTTQSTTKIVHTLRELLAPLLNRRSDTIPTDKPFSDLGVDSLMGINFVQKINKEHSIQLPRTILYQKTTISDLAQKIHELLPQAERDNCRSGADLIEEKKTGLSCGSRGEGGIAVIGFAGRFPKAATVQEFWDHICNIQECVEDIAHARWYRNYIHDYKRGKCPEIKCLRGGFLSGIEAFAADFFEISPAEALVMDPQQRLFLECAWEALEKAGYAQRGVLCNLGLFVGAEPSDYKKLLHESGNFYHSHTLMGNSEAILASRLSYFLNSRGPAVTINTACSSSLVSIHMACESLKRGECELALAGGVSLFVTPEPYIVLSEVKMLSKTSSCSPFSDCADGLVPSEAVGAVVLKPLEQAIRDGDMIYGVVKGSGINQDGRSNGLTAPNEEAQVALLKNVYTKNQINPETIGYLETHGTGTVLGDPIEFQAASTAFSSFSAKRNYCALGAVKGLIGHPFAASGVVGFIKALLVLKHRLIPKALLHGKINQDISVQRSPFYFPQSNCPLPAIGGIRRVALSSFGFSGTNAHIVLEEAPERSLQPLQNLKFYLIPLSSYYLEGIPLMAEKLIHFLLEMGNKGNVDEYLLANLMYTLTVKRMHHAFRYVFIVQSIEDLLAKLKSLRETFPKSLEVFSDLSSINHIFHSLQNEIYILSHWQALASFYVKGGNVNWRSLFEILDLSARIIDIPSLPLRKDQFWPQNEIPTAAYQADFSLEKILNDIYEKQKMPSSEELEFIAQEG